MQIKNLLHAAVAATLLSLAMPATADRNMPYHGLSEEQRQEVRERWEQMTPEEQAKVRRQADEYWSGLSDEERAAKREELHRYHSRGSRSRAHDDWKSMTSEERQAHREEMRQRWEAMTPEERKAHPGMMRDQRAADPEKGEYGRRDGKAKGERKGKPE